MTDTEMSLSKNGVAQSPAAPGATSPDAGLNKTVSSVLGEIVWLMSQSPEYKQYLISDLEWLVMPPILLLQFRIFYHEGKPAAVVFYARVSDEVAGRLDAGAPTLRPGDWKSGDTLRVVKVISPFGPAERFAQETIATVTNAAAAQV